MSAQKFNQERLMQVLVAPQISEKATMVADKNEQVIFRVASDATKPEIKAAVELLFKVQVESVQVSTVKGKQKRFGHGSPQELEEGFHQPEAGSGDQFRRGRCCIMALVKVKPTSPGRRAVVKVVNENLHKGRPFAGLVEKQSKNAGRNNNGRVTVRHQGGGHKQHYRIVDFKRDKDGIPAKVERLEYDPNRTANIALLCYADGERRYIIAPRGLVVGQEVISGSEAPIKAIRNIPVGTTIHCIEMVPGKGAQMARSAGAGVQLMAREGVYAQVRLRSGEVRRVHVECRATIGEVGNEEHSLRSIGKAGAKRWRGIRPTVRGVAMNPVDHPHGGGEGRTAAGMDPVSPWGTKTKGYRTRKNKRTNSMIVQRRHKR
jgi:large subunit ribosomal protein L2